LSSYVAIEYLDQHMGMVLETDPMPMIEAAENLKYYLNGKIIKEPK
jgi:hypothetical protein